MTRLVRDAAILCALGLTACSTPTPPVVALYKTSSCQSGQSPAGSCGEPTAVVDVTGNAPAPEAGASAAAQFAERAEAEYIKALADPRMSKDAKSLRSNLAASLKPPSVSLDRRRLTRNLMITTTKTGDFNPDDRLQQTEVLITLDDPQARIVSWDNATSIYNTISAGTLQVVSQRGGETDLSLAAPATAPVAAGLGQKFTYGTTSTSTANANIQAESLTVTVQDGGRTLRVFRQGGPGVDLAGNVAVKVGFALSGQKKVALYRLDDLFGDKQVPIAPAKVLVTQTNIDVGPQQPLQASVTMHYILRHVTAGGGSLAPGTQDVVHRSGDTTPTHMVLSPLEETYPATYGLFLDTGAEPVSIMVAGLPAEPLCLASYDEAETLQRYLARSGNGARLGDAAIGWNLILGSPRPLSASERIS